MLLAFFSWWMSNEKTKDKEYIYHFTPRAMITHNNGLNYYEYGGNINFKHDSIEYYWDFEQNYYNKNSFTTGFLLNKEPFEINYETSVLNDNHASFSLDTSIGDKWGGWDISARSNLSWIAQTYDYENFYYWDEKIYVSMVSYRHDWKLSPSFGFSWRSDMDEIQHYIKFDISYDL